MKLLKRSNIIILFISLVVVLYQDLKGTILEPVKITDEEKERQEKEQKEQQTLSQWWISLLVAIAIIVILVAIIVMARFTRLMKTK